MGEAQQRRVKRIPFRKLHLPSDHIIKRPDVPGDIDLLNIDTRALVDLIGDGDRQVFAIPINARTDIDKGIPQFAKLKGDFLNGIFDLVCVIGLSLNRRYLFQ